MYTTSHRQVTFKLVSLKSKNSVLIFTNIVYFTELFVISRHCRLEAIIKLINKILGAFIY